METSINLYKTDSTLNWTPRDGPRLSIRISISRQGIEWLEKFFGFIFLFFPMKVAGGNPQLLFCMLPAGLQLFSVILACIKLAHIQDGGLLVVLMPGASVSVVDSKTKLHILKKTPCELNLH